MFLELDLCVKDARLPADRVGRILFPGCRHKILKHDFIAYTMMGRLYLELGWIHNNGQL